MYLHEKLWWHHRALLVSSLMEGGRVQDIVICSGAKGQLNAVFSDGIHTHRPGQNSFPQGSLWRSTDASGCGDIKQGDTLDVHTAG